MTPDGLDKKNPLTVLTAINPLDGRYRTKLINLTNYFSEYALMKARTEVEVSYLLALSEKKVTRQMTVREKILLQDVVAGFSLDDARDIKEIEKTTRHDVKAMERHFRKILSETSLKDIVEMVHFGLTSEDINNIAYRLLLSRFRSNVVIPRLKDVTGEIAVLSKQYKMLPMLARTHGQAAVGTTLGKELAVFALRLHRQVKLLGGVKLTGKLGGAIGNFNAHVAGLPNVDWISFTTSFITSLGLTPNLVTTQINTYDDIAEFVQTLFRINTIIIGLNQDIWRYISDGWFVQEVKKGEVGSSTMPQKINPIDFENSEGNAGLANALLAFFAQKLPVSRLQRDLTDSTVMRNMGVALGYSLMSYMSLATGLSRVRPDEPVIERALASDWSILSEAVQTILRREGVEDPYSLIAGLTRGKHLSRAEWEEWLENLPVSDTVVREIARLTPQNYIGLASQITDEAVKEIENG